MKIKRETLENYHINSIKLNAYMKWYSKSIQSKNVGDVFLNSLKATYSPTNFTVNATKNVLWDIRKSLFNMYPGIIKETNKMIKSDLDQGIVPNYINEMYSVHCNKIQNKESVQEEELELSKQIVQDIKELYPAVELVSVNDTNNRYGYIRKITDYALSGLTEKYSGIWMGIRTFFTTFVKVFAVMFIIFAILGIGSGSFSIGSCIYGGLSYGMIFTILFLIFGKIYLAIAGTILHKIDYNKNSYVV